ncbi:MAG: hypothetical protein MMC23_000217 [Stictis urceolatum]|nr:hypothetical protein [Stictis urceolata]
MATPPINIIGAGLSGLTLGLCLKHKGIPTKIYSRASPSRNNYGITLYSSTIRPLLSLLSIDEFSFRQQVAIDRNLYGYSGSHTVNQQDTLRCHRGRLEALLAKSLPPLHPKTLAHVLTQPESKEINAVFDDSSTLSTICLIGCDGAHSTLRSSFAHSQPPRVLPYAVYNGQRRLSQSKFAETIASHMPDPTLTHTLKTGVRLEIKINDATDSHVDLGYTSSRRARGTHDPLYRPNRSKSEATLVPEELYGELAALKNLPPPFDTIFGPESVREDRVLHWLMRSLTPSSGELTRLASRGVVLVGDAAHAMPILGGEGANLAVRDAVGLAEWIAECGIGRLEEFVQGRVEAWRAQVEGSERRIGEMHASGESRL